MQRALLVVLSIVLAFGLWARPARAALMSHYDLDSLTFESDAVVLVTKVRERVIDPYNKATVVRVKRVYASSELKEADVVELDFGDYSFEPMFGWGEGKAKPVIAPDMIVFLTKRKNARDGLPWFIESSGLRIFADGKVHRFVQENNPGLYGPRTGELGPGGAPLDLPGFERELARATARAALIRAAIAEPSSPARTKKLLDLVPSEKPHDASAFGEDRVGRAILLALARDDLDAFLDVRSRSPRVHAFGLNHGVPPERLLDIALNRTALLPRRLAALALLEGMFFELSRQPTVAARAAALLDDPAPEIRLGALALSFGDGKTPTAFVDTLVRRFAIETNAKVRHALFMRARREHVVMKLALDSATLPVIYAERQDDTIHIAWAGLDEMPGYATNVVLEAHSSTGKIVRSANLARTQRGTSSSSSYSASMTVPIELTPPFEGGTHDLQIEVVVNKNENDTPLFTRRIALGASLLTGTMVAPPPSASVPLAVPSATSASASATAPSPAPSSTAPPSTSRCGCRAVGEPSGGAAAMIAFGACGLTLVRRRRVKRQRARAASHRSRRRGCPPRSGSAA